MLYKQRFGNRVLVKGYCSGKESYINKKSAEDQGHSADLIVDRSTVNANN